MVSRLILPFCAALQPHFFLDGWKQTERRGRRVKGARSGRVHRSAAQTLDSAPVLGTLSREKMEIPLAAFFSTRLRARAALLQDCNPQSRIFFLSRLSYVSVRL